MRFVQYRILTRLLNDLTIPEYIHAFEKNKSIPVMARLHTNKKVVLSLDLKDFFHSIKQKTVKEILESLGAASLPARTLSEICTYKSFVPQGALTSPKIANIITAKTFGPVVKEYCAQKGLTLTIYADDITMSSNTPGLDIPEILEDVYRIVRSFGFRINFLKTKVMTSSRRQYVCGVVVNTKTNMLKKDRYKLRAIVHNIVNNGVESEATKSNLSPLEFISYIKGRINWFKQLNPDLGGRLYNKLDTYLTVSQIVPNITLAVPEQNLTENDEIQVDEPVPWENS